MLGWRVVLAGKWEDNTALTVGINCTSDSTGAHTPMSYTSPCMGDCMCCLPWCEMYYADRMKSWRNVQREAESDKRTTSRGRKVSSCRRTSSPTAPPMGVALSRDTTSSWVRPFRSTPFTWTGDKATGFTSKQAAWIHLLAFFLNPGWNIQIACFCLLQCFKTWQKQQIFTL